MSNIQNLTASNLASFYGSENIYYNPYFRKWKYTDGIKFVSDNGAAWLITDILSHLCLNKKLVNVEFLVCTLKVDQQKKTAILTFDEGYDNGVILAKQKYPFTDFPLPEIKFYAENHMLMLTSER